MKTYVDANALIRLYLNLDGGSELDAALKSVEGRRAWPLPAPRLLQLEVVNGIHRMVFESRSGGQWRATPESAACALANFEADLDAELFLLRSPIELADVAAEFHSLAARHTASHGFRTYDLIHVASAVTLRCLRFLSFDTKANALAKLVGLETI